MITFITAQRTGLFDLLGRLWAIGERQKAEHQDRQTALDNLAAAIASGVALPDKAQQTDFRYQLELQLRASNSFYPIFRLTADLVRRVVSLDLGRSVTEREAAREVIRQFLAGGFYVGASHVSTTVDASPTNVGDAVAMIVPLTASGDAGFLWEPDSGQIIASTNAIQCFSREAVPLDGPDWPQGAGYSGEAVTITPLQGGWLRNQALETTNGRLPEWLIEGSQWFSVLPPQDEIQFSAEPSGGSFRLAFTNRFGTRRISEDLPANATPAAVARALSSLDSELASLRVAARAAGYGYTIDYPLARFDLPIPEIESDIQGATVTIERTRSGTPGGYAGMALGFLGNGTENTGIYQRFVRTPRGVAVLVLRVWHDGATSGTLQIGLFDGATPQAAPIPRANGQPNALNVTLANLPANQFHMLLCPLAWATEVDGYIGFRLTSPITSGKKLILNWPQAILVSPSLRRPSMIVFANRFGPWPGDSWSWIVTNDLAGAIQTWWLRVFQDNDLALPISGSTLIPDSIIAL